MHLVMQIMLMKLIKLTGLNQDILSLKKVFLLDVKELQLLLINTTGKMKYMEMVLVKNLEYQLQEVEKTEIIIYQQDLIIREV